MRKIRSFTKSLATILMMALLVSVILPFSSRVVLAAGEEIEVNTYNELVNALKSSDNAGKTIKLTKNISGGTSTSNLNVKYPMTLNLNGRTLTLPNGKRMSVSLNGSEDVFKIIGKASFSSSLGQIKGNYNGTFITLSMGYLVIEEATITNSNTNGYTLSNSDHITINSGSFKSPNALRSKIKINSLTKYTKSGTTQTYDGQLFLNYQVVSDSNCKDVFEDGIFSYDISTKTLSFGGYFEGYILSHIDDLTISVTKKSEFSGIIDVYGNTTFTGGNKLTVRSSDEDYSINQYLIGKNIIVKDISLEIFGKYAFSGDGFDSNENLIIENAEIVDNAGFGFSDDKYIFSSISLKNCKIIEPKDAVVKDGIIFESDGITIAKNVKIRPDDYWKPTEYTWSDDYSKCVAIRTSRFDSSVFEKESVITSSKVKIPATTTVKGTTTYTATFYNSAFTTQSKDVQNIPVLPYDPNSNNNSNQNTNQNTNPGTDISFEDFVERLYVVALNRQSEPEGKEFWCTHVGNGDLNGAQCANEFLLSKEFKDRGLSDEEFLKVLYKTFFDRDAANDPDGFNFWMNSLKTEGRDKVVDGFINSTEWCNICATYGVKSGATRAKASIASKNAIAFATRLYTECLGREPEEDGLKFWSLGLTNLELTGKQAAHEFFFSKEFNDFNLNNEGLLTRMYKTFMGREPDTDGMNFWLNEMSNGMTKEQVFNNFVNSAEFTQICKDYAIDRG